MNGHYYHGRSQRAIHAMVHKIQFIISIICLFYLLILSERRTMVDCEHGDVETQTITLCLYDVHNNMHTTESMPFKSSLSNFIPANEYSQHTT